MTTTFKNSFITERVNIVRNKHVNTAMPKAVLNVVKGNEVYVVKALACWVWKPKTKVIDHVSKHNSASITLKKFDYIDAQGGSKFIQIFLNKQLDGMPTQKEKYDVSFQTKNVFANMKRNGKGFSSKETPFFPTMVGPNKVQMDKGSAQTTNTQHTPTFDMPPSKPKNLGNLRERLLRRHDTMRDTSAHTRYERVSKMSSDSLLVGVNTPRSDEDKLKHLELMKFCTTLQKKDLDLEDKLKRTKIAQQTMIDCLERRVKKIENKQRSRTHKLKRLYKVGLTARVISSSDDEALDKEDTSKQGRLDEIDADEDIAMVSTHEDVVQDEGIEDVGEEEVVESTKKDEVKTTQESSSKIEGDELEQERSKKQKVKDDKESEELKKCLEIIPDDGDDVTIDATPLSSKSPTIVDYKIYKEGKKNYF
uniref:Retrovirus-related Pol polyprotein from transposon TNT 1-94 n=1 Tax=Tanacetum cinerariifolium TaxID=118510 RepID=A0A6L2JHL0_TANCI|nr:hypothetical protein [Tanacetum cinerariifolium]